MALINREQALSHPFANGHYDKKHADEHFIMGFEDYKEWLEDLPTVEAIPKADYENRLKADMVAMLTDTKDALKHCEITGLWKANYREGFNDGVSKSLDAIQQKINELKENTDN